MRGVGGAGFYFFFFFWVGGGRGRGEMVVSARAANFVHAFDFHPAALRGSAPFQPHNSNRADTSFGDRRLLLCQFDTRRFRSAISVRAARVRSSDT